MKTQFSDYELVCVGSYTAKNFEEQLRDPVLSHVHPLLKSLFIDNLPSKAQVNRTDLVVREKKSCHGFARPANLFELVWFGRKYPNFPVLYGSIETYYDEHLNSFMKEFGMNLNIPVFRYNECVEGVELTLMQPNSSRDSEYLLVVP